MKNDHDKRDFVAGGAAAGVAAAFGAPVGGILFTLEEASSFWSSSLTWKVFLCSCLSSFTQNILKQIFSGNITNNYESILFGKVDFSPYEIWEIPFFVILAIIGGLLGACFNSISFKINSFRRKYYLKIRYIR